MPQYKTYADIGRAVRSAYPNEPKMANMDDDAIGRAAYSKYPEDYPDFNPSADTFQVDPSVVKYPPVDKTPPAGVVTIPALGTKPPTPVVPINRSNTDRIEIKIPRETPAAAMAPPMPTPTSKPDESPLLPPVAPLSHNAPVMDRVKGFARSVRDSALNVTKGAAEAASLLLDPNRYQAPAIVEYERQVSKAGGTPVPFVPLTIKDVQSVAADVVRKATDPYLKPALSKEELASLEAPEDATEAEVETARRDRAFKQQLLENKHQDTGIIDTGIQALGSSVPVMASLLVNPVAGAAAGIASGIGETTTELDAFEAGKGTEVSPGTRAAVGALGGVIGAIDTIIPAKVLGPLRKVLVSGVANAAARESAVQTLKSLTLGNVGKQLAKTAVGESGTEGFQELANNLVARGLYNPDKDIMDNVLTAAAAGAFVGLVMQGGTTAAQKTALHWLERNGVLFTPPTESGTVKTPSGKVTVENVPKGTMDDIRKRNAEVNDDAVEDVDEDQIVDITPAPATPVPVRTSQPITPRALPPVAPVTVDTRADVVESEPITDTATVDTTATPTPADVSVPTRPTGNLSYESYQAFRALADGGDKEVAKLLADYDAVFAPPQKTADEPQADDADLLDGDIDPITGESVVPSATRPVLTPKPAPTPQPSQTFTMADLTSMDSDLRRERMIATLDSITPEQLDAVKSAFRSSTPGLLVTATEARARVPEIPPLVFDGAFNLLRRTGAIESHKHSGAALPKSERAKLVQGMVEDGRPVYYVGGVVMDEDVAVTTQDAPSQAEPLVPKVNTVPSPVQPVAQVQASVPAPVETAAPAPKRGRGRPRKQPLQVAPVTSTQPVTTAVTQTAVQPGPVAPVTATEVQQSQPAQQAELDTTADTTPVTDTDPIGASIGYVSTRPAESKLTVLPNNTHLYSWGSADDRIRSAEIVTPKGVFLFMTARDQGPVNFLTLPVTLEGTVDPNSVKHEMFEDLDDAITQYRRMSGKDNGWESVEEALVGWDSGDAAPVDATSAEVNTTAPDTATPNWVPVTKRAATTAAGAPIESLHANDLLTSMFVSDNTDADRLRKVQTLIRKLGGSRAPEGTRTLSDLAPQGFTSLQVVRKLNKLYKVQGTKQYAPLPYIEQMLNNLVSNGDVQRVNVSEKTNPELANNAEQRYRFTDKFVSRFINSGGGMFKLYEPKGLGTKPGSNSQIKAVSAVRKATQGGRIPINVAAARAAQAKFIANGKKFIDNVTKKATEAAYSMEHVLPLDVILPYRFGRYGKLFNSLHHYAKVTGERMGGKYMKVLEDGGINSKEIRDQETMLDIHDVLEGYKPAAKKAEANKLAVAIMRVNNSIAATARSLGVKVTTASGRRKAFKQLSDYFHHSYNYDALMSDTPVRRDVIANMKRRGWVKTDEEALQLIQECVDFMTAEGGTPVPGHRLTQWMIQYGGTHGATQNAVQRALIAYRASVKRLDPGAIKTSGLEYARKTRLPIYDPNVFRVVPQNILSTAARLEIIRQFGQDNDVQELLTTAASRDGYNTHEFIKKMNQVLGQQNTVSDRAAKILAFLRGFVLLRMAWGVLPNAGQTLNYLELTDPVTWAWAQSQAFTQEARDLVVESGAFNEQVLLESALGHQHDTRLARFGQAQLRYLGFSSVEAHNRRVGAMLGKKMLETRVKILKDGIDKFISDNGLNLQYQDITQSLSTGNFRNSGIFQDANGNNVQLSKKLRDVYRQLSFESTTFSYKQIANMLENGIQKDDVLQAAQEVSNYANFRSTPDRVALASLTPAGKAIWMYKHFSFHQLRFRLQQLQNLVQGTYDGNWRRAMRGLYSLAVMSSVAPLFGYAIQQIRSMMFKHEPREYPDAATAYLDSIYAAGTLGIIGDFLNAVQRKDHMGEAVMDWSRGPVVELVSSSIGTVGLIGHHLTTKDKHGRDQHMKAVGDVYRFTLVQLPAFRVLNPWIAPILEDMGAEPGGTIESKSRGRVQLPSGIRRSRTAPSKKVPMPPLKP